MEKKQYPDNFLFAMESFRPDDIVLVLLKKPKLLPRLPAKNPPRPQLSPRISTDGGAMPYKFELQHRENLRPENLRLCTLLMSPPRNRVPQRRHLPPPPVCFRRSTRNRRRSGFRRRAARRPWEEGRRRRVAYLPQRPS